MNQIELGKAYEMNWLPPPRTVNSWTSITLPEVIVNSLSDLTTEPYMLLPSFIQSGRVKKSKEIVKPEPSWTLSLGQAKFIHSLLNLNGMQEESDTLSLGKTKWIQSSPSFLVSLLCSWTGSQDWSKTRFIWKINDPAWTTYLIEEGKLDDYSSFPLL